jgi:pimeloyl-ACP methyl ester carboxylesterase
MFLYICGALLLVYLLLILRTFTAVHLTPRLQQWLSSGTYYTYANSIRIYYREYRATATKDKSQNKILLLLHGFPSSSWDWHPIWQPLCDDFDQVIAPDFIGFGFSDKPSSFKYSIMAQTDMIVDLLSKLLDTSRLHR